MNLTHLLVAITVFVLLFCAAIIVGAGLYSLAWHLSR